MYAMHSTSISHRSPHTSGLVDNTDWLKTVAIILVTVDHIGYFFIKDAQWWDVFGRLAAPTFFYLIGYAHTRSVPFHWIWLGIILTLLESWNANGRWVSPNVLLSFALIRAVRPYAQAFLQRYGSIAVAILVCALIALAPVTGKVADYGAEGWLWALFGLCERIYIDGTSATDGKSEAENSAPPAHAVAINANPMRFLACVAAALAYIWQEQTEYSFRRIHFAVFVLGVGVLSTSLSVFRRGPSRIQPPEPVARTLRFISRNTLEIYAIQLAGSELLVKFVPDLSP
jgi:surface polysaccharide O-acyltransferase-like enzyme